MGCGYSASNSITGRSRHTMRMRHEGQELTGKIKFLSCPAVGECVNMETKERWFIIAFAPLNVHGLIIAARNVSNGKTLLVKDVTDLQLTKEKEKQKITMSWNLFFKAVNVEITKINRGGAKIEFEENSINLEIKIAIAGAIHIRKIDVYRCTLEEVDNSLPNIFKYIVEPIATYYCKKRSDLVDKVEHHREKNFGDLESATIVRQVSIEAADKEIRNYVTTLRPLQLKYERSIVEANEKLAKTLLTRQVIFENTKHPIITKTGAFDGHFAVHADPMAPLKKDFIKGEHDDAVLKALPSLVRPFSGNPKNICKKSPPKNRVASSYDYIVNALYKCESDVSEVEAVLKETGNSCAIPAAYLYLRFVDLVDINVTYKSLTNFIQAISSMFASSTSPLYGSNRSTTVLCFLLNTLVNMGPEGRHRVASSTQCIFNFITAAFVMGVDHPGYCNSLLRHKRAFISTLYSGRSPAERHAIAIANQELRSNDIKLSLDDTVHIGDLILCTDPQMSPSIEEIAIQRFQEIYDFSRKQYDRSIAGGVILRAVDSAIFNGNHPLSQKWVKIRSEVKERERDYAETLGVVNFSQKETTTYDKTLEVLSSIFPELAENSILFRRTTPQCKYLTI
eukprot:Tbor_TRINITY_DN4873_c0_g3::TRINITY_DN4873_c0_g3_i1::g.1500::m.1500